MKRLIVGAIALAASAAPIAAQSKPTVFTLTPYAGYMFFGDYFENSNNIEFSNENGGLYGAQASLDLGRVVSIYGNFGYTKTKWTFENYFGAGNNLNLDDVGVWVYDGGLQLRMPTSSESMSGISPFVQVGAGAVRYSSESDDIQSSSSTNAAFNFGGGIDWQIGKFGIRLMAKDYVTSLDWSKFDNVDLDDKMAHNWGITAGLKIGF